MLSTASKCCAKAAAGASSAITSAARREMRVIGVVPSCPAVAPLPRNSTEGAIFFMPPEDDTRRRTRTRMSLLARIACAMAGAIFLALAFMPVRYVAVARVLLPPAHTYIGPFVVKAAVHDISVSGEPGSRGLAIEHWDHDPHAAALAVNSFLRKQLGEGMSVIDEAPVPFTPIGPGRSMRVVYGFFGLLCLAFLIRSLQKAPPPERALVRHALRFARNGEKAMLIDTGGRMRVVLSRAPKLGKAPELRVLATLAGGALIVARLERGSVAPRRRRSAKTVANS